jgi:lipopolysaccharide export system permease protein
LQFHRLYRRILLSTPALELEANSVKKYNDTVIVTGNVRGNAIDNLLILDRTSDGERRIIMANNAELKDMGAAGLALDLTRAFIQSSKEMVREDYDYASANSLRYHVPQEDLIQATSSISPREMSSRDVYKEIVNKTAELDVSLNERKNRLSAAAIAYEEILRMGSSSENWGRRTNQFSAFQREVRILGDMRSDRGLSIYWLEFYKKFSVPFGAFSFIFLAVALGLMAKKSGQTVGFIFGLIISVIYWALLLGGQTVGIRMGTSPFWSMWAPNIMALTAGLILTFVRVLR